jgi:hypothetical protein
MELVVAGEVAKSIEFIIIFVTTADIRGEFNEYFNS